MSELNRVDTTLLEVIAGMKDGKAEGAFNIRKDSGCAGRVNTENVTITTKTDKPGIDIRFVPGCKDSCHIPVIITESGLRETVYNDFYVGEDCDVTIIAGCGIHNCGKATSRHDGVHTFHIGKNSKVRYVERHYGEGDGEGKRVMNPETIAFIADGASMDMEMTQIKGVDDTHRVTRATLGEKSELTVREKIYTNGIQEASTDFCVDMNGADCRADVVSRSVAAEHSKQHFCSTMNGNAACHGHTECDAIIMDGGSVTAAPCLSANDLNAELIHEAAIGKIAGEQLVKLMTLGLTEKEAEEQIIKGFLH